jgi:hypothetical protein
MPRLCLVAAAGAADDANTGANLQKCKKNAVVVWAKLCRQITAASVLWLVAAVLHNYRGLWGCSIRRQYAASAPIQTARQQNSLPAAVQWSAAVTASPSDGELLPVAEQRQTQKNLPPLPPPPPPARFIAFTVLVATRVFPASWEDLE